MTGYLDRLVDRAVGRPLGIAPAPRPIPSLHDPFETAPLETALATPSSPPHEKQPISIPVVTNHTTIVEPTSTMQMITRDVPSVIEHTRERVIAPVARPAVVVNAPQHVAPIVVTAPRVPDALEAAEIAAPRPTDPPAPPEPSLVTRSEVHTVSTIREAAPQPSRPIAATAPLEMPAPLQAVAPPAIVRETPLAPQIVIGRVTVEIAAPPPAAPAPQTVVVKQSAPPQRIDVLRRGFGLGQG